MNNPKEDTLFQFPHIPSCASSSRRVSATFKDVMVEQASHDEVTWAQADIGKRYRRLAGYTPEDPCALIRNDELWNEYQRELEETTIKMGWDSDLHDEFWHNEIMEELYKEC